MIGHSGKIIDDYNHTLKIDNEGNLIEIFDNSAYKDRHYQKDDNFSVLKMGSMIVLLRD